MKWYGGVSRLNRQGGVRQHDRRRTQDHFTSSSVPSTLRVSIQCFAKTLFVKVANRDSINFSMVKEQSSRWFSLVLQCTTTLHEPTPLPELPTIHHEHNGCKADQQT